jgi:hypothetical protein
LLALRDVARCSEPLDDLSARVENRNGAGESPSERKAGGSLDYMNAKWMEFTGLSWEQLRDGG